MKIIKSLHDLKISREKHHDYRLDFHVKLSVKSEESDSITLGDIGSNNVRNLGDVFMYKKMVPTKKETHIVFY